MYAALFCKKLGGGETARGTARPHQNSVAALNSDIGRRFIAFHGKRHAILASHRRNQTVSISFFPNPRHVNVMLVESAINRIG